MSGAEAAADENSFAGAPLAETSPEPRTTMTWPHFLQRILKTLPRTFSSAIEYFA